MKVVKTYSKEECLKRSLRHVKYEDSKLYYLPDEVFDTYLNAGYRINRDIDGSVEVYDVEDSSLQWSIPNEFIEDILDGNRDDFIK